jgi:hypothetical protein
MATLTFRVVDHIFFICYLKNHMTFFWDFWSKLFGNILKISLISCSKIFKLIFLKSPAKNIAIAIFYFFSNIPSVCLFAIGHTLNHNFCNETTVWEKSVKALVNRK